MTKRLRTIALALFLMMVGTWMGWAVRSAEAADLNLEVAFTILPDEPVTVSISSHGMLYLVTAVELAAGSTGTTIAIPEIEPASYTLHLGKASVEDIRNFEFTLDADGTVVFTPSEAVQQEGNLVLLEP